MAMRTFRLWRGQDGQGEFRDYQTATSEGMVVLDAVHAIQAADAPDLACRWNCKAGKCGSCSAEINGSPRLMCMTRLDELPAEKPVTVEPIRAFPHIKDLVTDVSWNFEVKKRIKAFTPRPPDAADGTWRMQQADIDRVQEFRKCIECFLCQDVCHVLRDHHKHDEFIGPRFLVHVAALGDAPARYGGSRGRAQGRVRHRLLQHHEVLHQGLPGTHHHHRQRHHSAEGARRGPVLRPGDAAPARVHGTHLAPPRRRLAPPPTRP
jgi:succinate dehydrogenase / fumarate reductase, iron-sulfur subunit